MTYTVGHTKDCGYHLDQYESECTCGVSMTEQIIRGLGMVICGTAAMICLKLAWQLWRVPGLWERLTGRDIEGRPL